MFFRQRLLCLLLVVLGVEINAQDELTRYQPQGVNEGNLKFWLFDPAKGQTSGKRPLVVALHGCSQSAAELNQLAGFTQLARRYNFVVLFPEQSKMNNPADCFNWFKLSDASYGKGELGSIMEVIEEIKQLRQIDEQKVYAYGVSAGAVMAVSMLVNYSSSFAAGASIAGGPYRFYPDYFAALAGLQSPQVLPNELLARAIRVAQIDPTIPLPLLCIYHGRADRVVNIENSRQLRQQWLSASGCDFSPDKPDKPLDLPSRVHREEFRDTLGRLIVVHTEIEGLNHAIPVDPGFDQAQGGQKGLFASDVDHFSTWYILRDWGLIR